jgi:hypothetical protein
MSESDYFVPEGNLFGPREVGETGGIFSFRFVRDTGSGLLFGLELSTLYVVGRRLDTRSVCAGEVDIFWTYHLHDLR